MLLLLKIVSVVHIQHFLRLIGTTDDGNSDRQSFLLFIKFGTPVILIDLVVQIDIQVVHFGVLEHQSSVVDVECRSLETFDPLDVDGYCDLGG